MNKIEKTQEIEVLKDQFTRSQGTFMAEYRGMTVQAMTKFRMDVRKVDGEVKVIKNRLAKIATKGSDYEVLADSLKGPLLLVFSYKDIVGVAKAIRDNLSDTSPLNIKGGAIQGKMIDDKGVEALSKLPDRNTLLAMMLGAIRGPIQNFANVINAVPQGFVNALVAIKDKKEQQA